MDRVPAPDGERLALELPLREWGIVALLVLTILAVAPLIPFRGRTPVVETDYRIPYALSNRYDLYRRYTTLAAGQFPTLVIGDSVVWGQCARRDDSLTHHLNEQAKQPRFANAGLDGMHPLALVELLEYHAPAVAHTRVLLQFDPLWLLQFGTEAPDARNVLHNRPDLVPRLAAHFTGPFKEAASLSWSHLMRGSRLRDWGERLADVRIDFLAWSLDHPYESPLRAITAPLPPSEDSPRQSPTPWTGKPDALIRSPWIRPADALQWQAFLRILTLLDRRGNRVLVVLGPMNEHMMERETLDQYRRIKAEIVDALRARNVRCFVPEVLPSREFADICHPLGGGYALLARELLQKESAWLLGLEEPR